jgi:hypothetical protein
MAPLVLPEHRPTLREELRLHRPAARWAVIGVLVVVVGGLLAWGLAPTHRGVHYVHESAPTFNLRYADAFERLRPQRDEILHIRRRNGRGRVVDSFSVSHLRLPPYRGDVNGLLPVYAERVLGELRAAYPGLRLVEEGKARVNLVAGYSILFRVGRGRDRMYGREVLLPQPAADGAVSRSGVRMALRTSKGSGVAEPRALGAEGALKTPYRSFRYGTEAP